jgi:hypothetical protein
MTLFEFVFGAAEKSIVTVLTVVASHRTSTTSYGLIFSLTITFTSLVPRLWVMVNVVSVLFPIVSS